jgi:hypothetical protein
MRNNRVGSQAAKETQDKKDKGMTGYDNKQRDDRSTKRSGKPPRGSYSSYTMPPSRVYKEIMYSELKNMPPPQQT